MALRAQSRLLTLLLLLYGCSSFNDTDIHDVEERFFGSRSVTFAAGPLSITFGGKPGFWGLIPSIGWNSIAGQIPEPVPEVAPRFLFEICDWAMGLFIPKTPMKAAFASIPRVPPIGQLPVYQGPKMPFRVPIIPQAQGMQPGPGQWVMIPGTNRLTRVPSQGPTLPGQRPLFPGQGPAIPSHGVQNPQVPGTAASSSSPVLVNINLQQIGSSSPVVIEPSKTDDSQSNTLLDGVLASLVKPPEEVLPPKDCSLCNEIVAVFPNQASTLQVVEYLVSDKRTLDILRKFINSQYYFLPYKTKEFSSFVTFLEFLDWYIKVAVEQEIVNADKELVTALTSLQLLIPKPNAIGPLI